MLVLVRVWPFRSRVPAISRMPLLVRSLVLVSTVEPAPIVTVPALVGKSPAAMMNVPPFIARTVPVLVNDVPTLLDIVFPDIAASINPWLVTELKNPNVPPCVLSAPPIVTPEPIVRFVVVNCANRLLLVVPSNVTEPVPSTV